jgi:hypothetical protein
VIAFVLSWLDTLLRATSFSEVLAWLSAEMGAYVAYVICGVASRLTAGLCGLSIPFTEVTDMDTFMVR